MNYTQTGRWIVGAVLLAMVMIGCSAAPAADPAPDAAAFADDALDSVVIAEEPDARTSEGEVDPVEVERSLDDVEDLLLSVGADPEIAACYRTVLDGAGIAPITDLNQLQAVLGELTSAEQVAFNNCVG